MKHKIPKKYIKYITYPNNKYYLGMEFHRSIGINWYLKKNIDIELDAKIRKEDAYDSVEFLFNRIHNKRYYKNYKLYELYDSKLIFTNKKLGCQNCSKVNKKSIDMVLVEDIYKYIKEKAPVFYEFPYDYLIDIICKKCWQINNIKK